MSVIGGSAAPNSEEAKAFSVLTKKRAIVRAQITKLCNKIDQESNDFGISQININSNKCIKLKGDVTELDDKLLTICIDTN